VFRQESDDPFNIDLNPQILAALSSHVALFPSVSSHADESYPPQARKVPSFSDTGNNACKPPIPSQNGKAKNTVQSRLHLKSASVTSGDIMGLAHVQSSASVDGIPSGTFVRGRSVRRKLAPVDMAPSKQGQSTMLPVAQFPLSDETLGSLLTFCFPGNHFHIKINVLFLDWYSLSFR
jgi:hypothetical protein